MRVVVDTSTLISAVLWSGLPHRLIELAEAGDITLCMTEETLAEFREVLQRPKFAKQIRNRFTSVEEIMQLVLSLIELYPTIPMLPVVESDPDDDKFIVCALRAGAELLVSSDWHLLEMGSHRWVTILTARGFLGQAFPHLFE